MKALIFVADHYEDLELWYPKIRLEEAGWETVVAGEEAGKEYKGKNGYPCKADKALSKVSAKDYKALLIPGGAAPDKLRTIPQVLKLTREFDEQKKLIGFICHGGQVMISANLIKGRKVTGYKAIKDDLINAGATYKDQALVIDKNFISSRSPDDLYVFAKAMVEWKK